jgi:hypothetical protein
MNDDLMEQAGKVGITEGLKQLTGAQRRRLRRDNGQANLSGDERKTIDFHNGAKDLARITENVPDTSEASQQASRKGYRERAHVRKAKAAERRQKRALARRNLTSKSSKAICPDCGKEGEIKGHQDCQYPQN